MPGPVDDAWEKVSKRDAQYVARIPIGDTYQPCRSCTMFEPPASCSKVEGEIAAEGHCRFYFLYLPELTTDAERAPAINRDHDGPWLSCMSKDGATVYINRNLPEAIEIEDIGFDPASPLIAHEVPEFREMQRLVAEHNGDLSDEDRKAIYLKAHKTKGDPGDDAWCRENGVNPKKWNEWCGGEMSRIEKLEVKNPPPDADVKPFRHAPHGDLESTIAEGPNTDSCIVGVTGDSMLAFDRSLPPGVGSPAPYARREGLAFDRASVRETDTEGRLHVAVTNISKANICPYIGREIPNSEELGLEPDRIYRLLRDPDELRKAAPTFNRLPLLSKHVPVSAEDHQPDLVVGATGSDAVFEDPFLRNSLVIWAKDAIEGVEDESKKELSSAYRYRADMTPGEYFGEHYDGVMRDIIGNHVALVKEGRAGTDVVVGDEQPKEIAQMTKIATVRGVQLHGALMAYLAPRIAQDQKVDLRPVVAELAKIGKDAKLKDHRDALMGSVRAVTKGKLAKDASVDGLAQVIDMLDAHGLGGGSADADPPEQPTVEGGMKEDDPDTHLEASQHESPFVDDAEPKEEKDGELPAFLKGKLGAEDYDRAMDMLHGRVKGADNDPKLKQLGAADGKITKTAMDAAIAAAVKAERATGAAIREAEKFVKPWVGELAIAQDSAEKIYLAALGALGLDEQKFANCDATALRAIIEAQPRPGARNASSRNGHAAELAHDARGADDFAKMFPEAMRVGVL